MIEVLSSEVFPGVIRKSSAKGPIKLVGLTEPSVRTALTHYLDQRRTGCEVHLRMLFSKLPQGLLCLRLPDTIGEGSAA